MKMNEEFLCCDGCFETIGKRSVTAARIWLDLCRIKIEREGLFALPTNDLPELRLLEILGFITTTDEFNRIIVKVHGQQKDDEGTYFCCGECCND